MDNLKSISIPKIKGTSNKDIIIHNIGVKNIIDKSIFRRLIPYLMITPAIVILGMFVIYPIFYMVYLSFFEWDLMQDKAFVGFDNFIILFKDETFWQVSINSFKYVFLTVSLSLIISILLALYLKKDTKINRILQSISFFPYIISLVSISFIWMWLMDTDYGLLNFFLELIGLPKIAWLDDPKIALNSLIIISVWKSIGYNTIIIISAMKAVPSYLYEAWLMDSDYGLLNFFLQIFGLKGIGWLDDPKYALNSLILIAVWKSIGYNTIIIISAMKAVPSYLYEAAKLDKSSEITTFFKITLPMISPTLFFITLMNIIGSFKVFEPVNLITQGGPMNSTNTFVNMIYENGFKFYKIGYASAIGVVLMFILGICTLLYFKNLDKRVHYR